ncbi:predicted protein [Lichtheimia corymbifera JMRC:FSU:9682]|uniref:F-box domain-containing protein n=1 Tax=Lichtheimia corymbifera JMRC:FSU:9682 TaxID=1263082 RepID=A0A068S5S3_9FUNG|nr:predicted protein [Lichtheimia corymbifera JMRC:FSU:9682]
MTELNHWFTTPWYEFMHARYHRHHLRSSSGDLETFSIAKETRCSSMFGIQSALIATQYAPRVHSIYLLMRDEGIELTYDAEGQPSERHGIRNLTITTETEEICTDTTSIVKQHHKTLERIVWSLDTSHDTDTIDNLNYPHLKKLYVNTSGWQLPCNAPALEELEMTLQTIHAHPAVLNAIPPNLKKLALDLQQGLTTVTKSLIEHYLGRLARQHQLKHLVIKFDHEDNVDSLLDVIIRNDRLERLEITLWEWDSYQMGQFFDRLVKGCPRLVRLEVISKTVPSTNAMNTLKQLQHLKELAFLMHDFTNYESFWSGIPTILQLKSLMIYAPRTFKNDKAEYLKQQRPDLQIIVDTNTFRF